MIERERTRRGRVTPDIYGPCTSASSPLSPYVPYHARAAQTCPKTPSSPHFPAPCSIEQEIHQRVQSRVESPTAPPRLASKPRTAEKPAPVVQLQAPNLFSNGAALSCTYLPPYYCTCAKSPRLSSSGSIPARFWAPSSLGGPFPRIRRWTRNKQVGTGRIMVLIWWDTLRSGVICQTWSWTMFPDAVVVAVAEQGCACCCTWRNVGTWCGMGNGAECVWEAHAWHAAGASGKGLGLCRRGTAAVFSANAGEGGELWGELVTARSSFLLG